MILVEHLSFLTSIFSPIFLSSGGGVHPGISKAVNLTLFLGVMYFLLRKPTRDFFSARFAAVRTMLERAAKERDAATAKMAELDARLNRLDVELRNIKGQSEQEAAAERSRIEAETGQEIEKIKTSARREIESAKQVALSDLRNFAAVKAVDLAEQMIKRELKPEDDAKLLTRMADAMSSVK
jgi:F-type H+-transporting ATPase subunit b